MASRLHRLLGVAATIVLAGSLYCGAVSAASTEITHLAYSGHGAEWRVYLEEMAKKFETQTNIKVNIIQTSDYTPKVLSMIAGGVAPDVTDYHPVMAGALITKGLFIDLRPYIERDKVKWDQIPAGARAGLTTPSGAIWGLPWDIYPMVTIFNADMFAQQGLLNPQQLGEGWTLDKFAQSAKRLTVDADGDNKTDRYGVYHLQWRWEMHVHQNGGMIWDKLVFPTKSLFNTPVVRQTVAWLAELMAVDGVNSELSGYTTWKGNVGMTLAYSTAVIKTYLADKVSFSWGIAPQPKGTASRAARANPDSNQILADSKNKEAAWKWLRFLSQTEQQLQMAAMTSRLPAYREAALQFPKVVPNLPSNWMVFIDTAFDPASYTPYVVPQDGAETLVNNILKKVWAGQMAAETGLQQIHEQLQPILAQ